MCDTYNYDYLKYSTFNFNFIDFSCIKISLSNFALFTVKSPSATQRSVSQENAYKKELKPVAFSLQNYRLR